MSELFLELEVAQILRVSTLTLRRWRARKIGPPTVKIRNRIYYPAGDLVAWLAAEIAQGRHSPAKKEVTP